jgi:hypothetical protein
VELFITVIAFIAIISIAIFSVKNKHKRNGKLTVVSLILLSSSSVLIAFLLKSMYSLLFYALQIISLVLALGFAINAAKSAKENKG